jgi:phosphate:Na+ symporter
MLTLLTSAGGVALLLFGVRYLRKGLDRLFGQRLGVWMSRMAATRFSAFLAGLGVSIITPSSTTVSLLAVHAVKAGRLSTRQTLSIMLGANIGLTAMVQLIALDVYQLAPVLILVGVILFQFMRAARARGIGQVILAVGFLLLAMNVISDAAHGHSQVANDDMMKLVEIAERYPFVLFVLATVLTILLQSSTATIGLIIGLSTAGQLTLGTVVPIVLGANVGMAITTLIVGFSEINARRLAFANLFIKALAAIVLLFAFAVLRERIPALSADRLPLMIAQLHTGYNVLLALVGLPLVGVVSNMIERVVPEPAASMRRGFGPKFVHTGPIDSTAVAMGLSLREILHMAEIIRDMLHDAWLAMKTNDESRARAVGERDDMVDELDEAVKSFLTRLVRAELDQHEADEQLRQLRYLNELETIGDIIDKNVVELVVKKIRNGSKFSDEGQRELDDYFNKIAENLELAITAFATRDRRLAQKLLRHKERINQYEQDLRDRHFRRLNEGLAESHETSAIHLDLLTHLKRINSALTRVAYAILQDAQSDREETAI